MRTRRKQLAALGRGTLLATTLGTTALVALPRAEAQSSIDYWPPLPGVIDGYRIMTMSGNGAYIGGAQAHPSSGLFRAYRWDAAGNGLDLGSDPGASSYVTGLSFDGRAASGHSYFNLVPGAFRWTEDGGIEYIGSLGGSQSWALDISNDGSTIAGLARRADFRDRGFVWIEGATTGVANNPQMYEIPMANSGSVTIGIGGVSGDGRYVVGNEKDAADIWRTYRYDVSGIQSGIVTNLDIGDLGGSINNPNDISDDGSVIVGYAKQAAEDGGNNRAFRWVEGSTGGYQGGSMHDLGTLGGDSSFAHAVSGDGNVVVGTAETEAGATYVPFRWTEDTGMIAVADWLAAAGVVVTVTLAEAGATNQDGSVVAGTMWNADGERVPYIARVVAPPPEPEPEPKPNPGGGIMDVNEYRRSLFSTTSIANAGQFLAWLPLNGAHHRPLMTQGNLSGDTCLWAVGDLGYHGGSDTGVALAEVGGCVDLAGGQVRAGLGVGTSGSSQDLALGGNSRLAGQYVVGEIDWQPDGTPLLLSLTGMLGGWQADIHRGYSNGAATAYSDGQTTLGSGVIRLRADWLEAATIGNTGINPWVSVGVGRTAVAGYVENGGPFPARFDGQALTAYEVRLGVTAVTEVSASTTLSTTLELAHRGGDAAAANGNVIGLFDFGLGGGQYGQTWVRIGADLDHRIGDNTMLSLSLNAASQGQDASFGGSIGLKAAF